MKKVEIKKSLEAYQWDGQEKGLPEGFFVCRPEVHYSAGREQIYFTYADLRPHNWISAKPIDEKPEVGGFEGGIAVKRQDGTEYFRRVYAFSFWEIKSEASSKRDYSAKFLDHSDKDEFEAFLDFVTHEGWAKSEDGIIALPPRIEYRKTDGGCGRGYKTFYMKKGDWLLIDGAEISVVDDEKFQGMNK